MNESQELAADPQPATVEDAVALCMETWVRAHQDALQSKRSPYEATEIASSAYLQALPRLSGTDNIRAFIACVAHGLAVGIVEGSRASRLLYAAQIARSAVKESGASRQSKNTPA